MGPCHHVIARPRVGHGGEGTQMWRVAVNMLSKESRIVDKGQSSSLEIEGGG